MKTFKLNHLYLSVVTAALIAILAVGTIFGINNKNNNNNFDGTFNPTTSLSSPPAITGTIDVDLTEVNGFANMVDKYQEAAVTVSVKTKNTNSRASCGSGIAIYSDGYIATNWHVIAVLANSPLNYHLEVTTFKDGEFNNIPARLIWYNIQFDLAIVCCDQNIPYVAMSDRWIDSDNKLMITEEVWALSTPYDPSLQGTFSKGHISSTVNRVSTSGNRVYENMIQHSCDISNGSSGSGLFDMQGKLVGLNTLGITASGGVAANAIYFATPIYPLIIVINKIVALDQDGNDATVYKIPTIGFSGYDGIEGKISGNEFKGDGVYIVEITENGPCDGNLEAGDVLVGISITSSSYKADEGYFTIDNRNHLLYALCHFNSGDSIKVYTKNGNAIDEHIITLA